MKSRFIITIHIIVALLATIIIFLCMRPLAMVAMPVLITDAVVSGITLSLVLFLLRYIIKYGHFPSLHFQQRIINYGALALLFVACWIGFGFLILSAFFSPEAWTPLTQTLTIRITIALLIYIISIQFYTQEYAQDTSSSDDSSDFIPPETYIPENTEPQSEKETLDRIAVRSGQKIEVVPVSGIIHIQAEGDYVMIHSEKGKFLKEQTMKSLEEQLPSDKFVRVHRSSIVNIDFIAQIELYDKQSQLLKLKNGAQVKISLSGYKLLKKTLGL